ALRRAAQSAAKSRSALGGFYRRLRARLGPAKAITATALAVGNDEDFAQHRRVCRHRSLLSVREEHTPVQLFGRAGASSSGSAGRTSSGSSGARSDPRRGFAFGAGPSAPWCGSARAPRVERRSVLLAVVALEWHARLAVEEDLLGVPRAEIEHVGDRAG